MATKSTAKKAPAKKITTAKKTTSKTASKKAPARKRTVKKTKGKCFVMMPFRSPFDIYYESIFIPAIKAANLEPIRADDLFRPSVIVSDLWEMIQEAVVLLSELTTKNANVFYELGLAHAIGKPVVLVSETMDDVPFDLQQLRIILYDKDDPAWGKVLGDSISNALKETLDSPINAVPNIFRKKVKSQAPEQDATLSRLDALENQLSMLRQTTLSVRDKRRQSLHSIILEEYEDVRTVNDAKKWIEKWLLVDKSLKYFLKETLVSSDAPGELLNMVD